MFPSIESVRGRKVAGTVLAALRGVLDRLPGDERAMVTITTALMIIPLAIAAGLALDATRVYLVHSQLGVAVDTAALAGAKATDAADITPEATMMFDANFPGGFMGTRSGALTVTSDPDAGQITVVASTFVPTTLMRLAGFEQVQVNARAVAQREQIPMELAMVLDVTGSMAGSKITALKQAANDLLDILYGPRNTADGLTIAVVPFNARANIGTSRSSWLLSKPSGWGGCVNGRTVNPLNDKPPSVEKFPATVDVTYYNSKGKKQTGSISCPTSLLPLTAQKSTISTKIGGLAASGNTRIDMGARWGWRVLSEKWTGLWGTAGSPQTPDGKLVKAAIIMTDGQNEPASYDDATATQADANLTATCTAMKSAGIVIYTIGFQSPTAVRPLLSSCATSTSNYFKSPTAADLRRSFKVIANRLSALRLVE